MNPQYPYACRLNSFKARPDLYSWRYAHSDVRDLILRADQVIDLNNVDLNYPQHFDALSIDEILDSINSTHLKLSSINMRYAEPLYMNGGFTNPDPEIRKSAIKLTQQGADVCRQLGGSRLIIWPGMDGYDYPFQMDYARSWDWEIEGLQAVAEYAPDIKICIEYKPYDPRRYSLLRDVGTTLLAIEECGSANLGVQLDFCHLLMAGENPACAAALCIRQNKLFGLHLNDGHGATDDGLLIGSVNFSKTAEVLYYVIHSDYCDEIYFDTFPIREDPVKECAANIRRTNQLIDIVGKMDDAGIKQVFNEQDGLGAVGVLWEVKRS